MKKTLLNILLGLALSGWAVAQSTEPVVKTKPDGNLTADFKVPTGKTIQISSGGTLIIKAGATIQAEDGSTVTGFGSGGGGLTNFASTLTGGTMTFTGTLTTGRAITWRDVAGTVALTSDLSSYQPVDSDLTAIAALTTTTYGRSLLTGADAAAVRTLLELGTAAGANTTSSEGSPSAVSLASHTHSLAGSYITGTLPITKGGTGISDTPTNGQILIGNTTTSAYAKSALTAGTGITVTNSTGSITLAVNQSALTLTSIGGTLSVAKGGTGLTAFGTGISDFLAFPSSDTLSFALTDETGTEYAVFSKSPTLTDSLTITGATVTASAPVLNMSQTWNNAAVNFKGFTFNIVDTAFNSSDSRIFEISTTSAGPRVWVRGENGHLHAPRFQAVGTSSYLDANCQVAGSLIVQSGFVAMNNDQNVWIKRGAGSPEGVETASPGSLYLRTDGGAGTTFYVKESGTGNTGWSAK